MTTPILAARMVQWRIFKTHFYLLLERCSQNSKSAGSICVHLSVVWVSKWLTDQCRVVVYERGA